LGILCSLTPCQVDQHQLTNIIAAFANKYLTDGVRSRRGVVGGCGEGCPGLVSRVHHFQQFFGIGCTLLDDALDLYVVALILHDVEQILIVEQIEAAASVYLKEGHADIIVALDHVKELFHQVLLDLVHRKGLA
jgi:hypothetical protein